MFAWLYLTLQLPRALSGNRKCPARPVKQGRTRREGANRVKELTICMQAVNDWDYRGFATGPHQLLYTETVFSDEHFQRCSRLSLVA